ncbi:MAG: 50S ribosomal protein L10 [Thermoanaerobaculia bacterium]
MPLSRQEKETVLASYRSGLAEAPHVFLMEFKRLSVPEATKLRSQVRDSGAEYVVIRNRIALLATDGKALADLKEYFRGPTSAAFGQGDPVALAKALTDFAATSPTIEFKGGLLDGRLVAASEIKELATLPSREQLITKLVFLLQSPMTRLVRAMAGTVQQFVSVLEQIGQTKESQS